MKKIKYTPKADESLFNIGRSVAAEVRGILKDEMTDQILENPVTATVDYRNGSEKKELSSIKKDTNKDLYNMYSHTTSDGKISATRTTPEHERYVKEIYKDGSEKVSSYSDFEKKVTKAAVTDQEKSELNRIVRVSALTPDAYKTSEQRGNDAFKAFDNNKYLIEETAGRVGVPPELLAAVYFKKLSDNGDASGTLSARYAKLTYKRLYGKPLNISDEALNEYLKTPQGTIDFMAIGLKSEAEYIYADVYDMSKGELEKVLNYYGLWNDDTPTFTGAVKAYQDVFKDIFKKMPGKEYEVKV